MKDKRKRNLIRNGVAFGLILSLSIHCFYQLGFLTYFYTNYHYIVTEVCNSREKEENTCLGMCFVEENLAHGEKSDRGIPYTHHQHQEIQFYVVLPFYLKEFPVPYFIKYRTIISSLNVHHGFANQVFRPPNPALVFLTTG